MITEHINANIETTKQVLTMEPVIRKAGETILDALKNGKKILIAGNGGSAAQAQHFSAEIVIRYKDERGHWPAIALNTDTSIITACANDYGYEYVFSKQVEAYGQAGDVLIVLSTSGNSPNILKAIPIAKAKGMVVIGLGGSGKMVDECNQLLTIPSQSTARIQEAHILIIHIWCAMIDNGIRTT